MVLCLITVPQLESSNGNNTNGESPQNGNHFNTFNQVGGIEEGICLKNVASLQSQAKSQNEIIATKPAAPTNGTASSQLNFVAQEVFEGTTKRKTTTK